MSKISLMNLLLNCFSIGLIELQLGHAFKSGVQVVEHYIFPHGLQREGSSSTLRHKGQVTESLIMLQVSKLAILFKRIFIKNNLNLSELEDYLNSI